MALLTPWFRPPGLQSREGMNKCALIHLGYGDIARAALRSEHISVYSWCHAHSHVTREGATRRAVFLNLWVAAPSGVE